MSYSSSTLLILGDSCAPVFDPPPVGGSVVVVSQSAMLLVLSSQLRLSGSLLTVLPCYCLTV